MKKVWNFISKWSVLGGDAMIVGVGILLCNYGIKEFYNDKYNLSNRK